MALFGFGKNNSKSSTTTNETSTETPNVPEWLRAPFGEYTDQWRNMVGLTDNPSLYTVGANGNQIGAARRAQGIDTRNSMVGGESLLGVLAGADFLGGMPYQQRSGGLLSNLENYSAPTVNMPQNWRASLTAPTGNYNANTLAGTDLSSYFSPFQSQVIDASMNDYGNLLAQGMNSIKANTPTGAYGGARQGVAMGQFAADAARNQASQLAGLRQSGFQNAQQAGQFDVNNRNQFQGQQNADLFSASGQNAAARNNMLLARNQADIGTQQFNSGQDLASAGLRRGIANDFGQLGSSINSDMLNQARFKADLANSMIGAGSAINADQRANTSLLQQTGDSMRGIDLANNPTLARMQYLANLGQMLGFTNADLFTGKTTNSTGTSSSKGSGTQFGFQLGGNK
ncbi:MAG: hypothetical protein EBR82_69900 [Caulobacteraceae bacterium]|nr:hypothetical protein [Caulobacteraceae bacterium]